MELLEYKAFSALHRLTHRLGQASVGEAFKHFDVDNSGTLSRAEMSQLLSEFFELGSEYGSADVPQETVDIILEAMDADGNGVIDCDEFEASWNAWFSKALRPVQALLIIDVQNDFIDGPLKVSDDAAEIVHIINIVRRESFGRTLLSQDWHPKNHCSFIESQKEAQGASSVQRMIRLEKTTPSRLHPNEKRSVDDLQPFDEVALVAPDGTSEMKQTLWPRHCVQGTWGANFHKELVTLPKDIIVKKGGDPCVDSYSAFWDNAKLNQTKLLSELREAGVTHIYMCGLALDCCVLFSALHAAEHGFSTYVIEDASRGLSEQSVKEAKEAMNKAGVKIVQASEIRGLLSMATLDEALRAARSTQEAKRHAATVDEAKKGTGHKPPSMPRMNRDPSSTQLDKIGESLGGCFENAAKCYQEQLTQMQKNLQKQLRKFKLYRFLSHRLHVCLHALQEVIRQTPCTRSLQCIGAPAAKAKSQVAWGKMRDSVGTVPTPASPQPKKSKWGSVMVDSQPKTR